MPVIVFVTTIRGSRIDFVPSECLADYISIILLLNGSIDLIIEL